MPDLGLFGHIERNRRNSVLLIVISFLVFLGLGTAIGAAYGSPWGGIRGRGRVNTSGGSSRRTL